MTKYGSWDGVWVGTGIAPLPGTRHRTTRVHPRYRPYAPSAPRAAVRQRNIAVGLKSVEQLTLDAGFSGFQGMTEV